MRKISIKMLVAITLVAIMVVAFATGCSLFVYNEDKDMQQVVIKIDAIEMEYNDPFMVDYTDLNGKAVKNNAGEVIKTVQRDPKGNPVHKPKVEGGQIVYVKAEDSTEDFIEQSYDNYFTLYKIEGNEAVSAAIYEFIGQDNGQAVWQDVDSGAVLKGDAATNAGLPALNKDGKSFNEKTPKKATVKWETEAKEYTKQELISYFNRSGQELIDQGATVKQAFDKIVTTMLTMHFMSLEADNHIKSGEVEWGLTETNTVSKTFYKNIDDAIKGYFAEIYADKGEEYIDAEEATDPSPSKPVPDGTDGTETKDYKEWTVDKVHYLGYNPNPASTDKTSISRNSLVRQGIRRWISSLSDTIEKDYTISDSVRSVYEQEIKDLSTVASDDATIEGLYPSLLDKTEDGDYKYSVIWYLYGQNTELNAKSSALSNYIRTIAVTNADVKSRYYDFLNQQKEIFSSNLESYFSAASGDSTILYFASDEYFYVKHILVPFSDETTADLTTKRESGLMTDESYKQYRQDKAPKDNASVYPVYKRINGENDTSRVYSVNEVYDDIKSKMNAASTHKEKEEAFESLIYTYNTDDGIFDKEMGYAVTRTPAKQGGKDETYVIEFATAARELRTAYLNGDVEMGAISQPVLGDYGYHILYLHVVPSKGEIRGMYDYFTAAEKTRIYDIIESNLWSQVQGDYFDTWSTARASEIRQKNDDADNKDKFIHAYESRYNDLYDKVLGK